MFRVYKSRCLQTHIHIPPNNRIPKQQQQRELTLCRIRNRNFLKNKTKYTIRNKIFALACHQRRGLAGNGMGTGMRLRGTLVYAWDPLTMVINQFPIMQLSETRVSNKNTRVHRVPAPPHLLHRLRLVSPCCRWSQRTRRGTAIGNTLGYVLTHEDVS